MWDTKEAKPYGSVDFPNNFFDIYLERRKQNIDFLKGKSVLSLRNMKKAYYLDRELDELNEFESQKVIGTLYHKVSKNEDLNPNVKQHFWRILKKADLRRLTESYDRNFRNISKNPLIQERWH